MSDHIDYGSVLNVIELVERLEMCASVHLDVTADHVWKPSAPLVACKLAGRYSEDLIKLLQGHPKEGTEVSSDVFAKGADRTDCLVSGSRLKTKNVANRFNPP